MRDGIGRLSVERTFKELIKLLAAPNPRPAVRAMAETGVLGVALPEAGGDLRTFERMVGRVDDPALRLSALLPEDAGIAEGAARRLRAPNALIARLGRAAGAQADAATDERAMRALAWREGVEAATDQARRAEVEGRIEAATAVRLIAAAESWERPRLPVGGHDATKAGAEPGPQVGRVLKMFEEGWIADDFPSDGHPARLAEAVAAVRAGRG